MHLPSPRPPYWLSESDDRCSSCTGGYAIEVEWRCELCDSPLCSLCIVVNEAEIRCDDCKEVSD
jgi:hypothetical protein